MKQRKSILSISQKKRLIQWEIPHLIQALKKEHQVVTVYLSLDFISYTEEKISFIFDGRTFFPLSLGEDFLGFLVCFHTLNTFKIQGMENFINSYLKEVFTMLSLPQEDSSLSLNKSFFKGKQLKHVEESGTKENKIFFPFLVKRERKEEFLKTAYSLYLKSSCFAFLNAEALKWKEKIFQELNGIFVCVPSFQNLSVFQQEILIQDLLQKKVSCSMVLGAEEKESLPPEYQKLFHTFA